MSGTIAKLVAVSESGEYKSGFACLVGEKELLTAAHIMEGSPWGWVEISGERFPIKEWRRLREGEEPTRDLAEIRLVDNPGAGLLRWEIALDPPQRKNFRIWTDDEGGKWVNLAPRAIWDQTAAAMLPDSGYALVRAALGLEKTSAEGIKVGDSGGPWEQDGKLVAITSRMVGREMGKVQTAYGTGTWQGEGKWKSDPPITGSILAIAIFLALAAAKLSQGKKKRLPW